MAEEEAVATASMPYCNRHIVALRRDTGHHGICHCYDFITISFGFLCVIAVLYSAFLGQIIDFLSSFGVTFFDYVSTRMAVYYGVGMSQGSYDAEMLESGGNVLGIRMLCIIIPMVLLYFYISIFAFSGVACRNGKVHYL